MLPNAGNISPISKFRSGLNLFNFNTHKDYRTTLPLFLLYHNGLSLKLRGFIKILLWSYQSVVINKETKTSSFQKTKREWKLKSRRLQTRCNEQISQFMSLEKLFLANIFAGFISWEEQDNSKHKIPYQGLKRMNYGTIEWIV